MKIRLNHRAVRNDRAFGHDDNTFAGDPVAMVFIGPVGQVADDDVTADSGVLVDDCSLDDGIRANTQVGAVWLPLFTHFFGRFVEVGAHHEGAFNRYATADDAAQAR